MKTKTVFNCQECGAQSQKWLGRCPECGAWNTLVEEGAATAARGSRKGRLFVIEPLNPVTRGHVLVIPRRHVRDFLQDWYMAGDVMEVTNAYLREYDVGPCNVITSIGREATQTIDHLHVHVVPRREGDGLALPWDAQMRRSANG